MSTYGQIAYEDLALLNAQWQQARPAMAGLGAAYGQHEYRDLSYLNARLRPILPATVGLSPDGLGAGSLSGNSMGADTSGFTKEQILEMQDQLNGALIQRGYKPIGTDGQLGPATCGAIQWFQENVDPAGGVSFAGACSSVTATPPTKVGRGGSPAVVPPSGTRPPMTAAVGGGATNWPLYGGAIAAIAIGSALIYRASKKR